MNRRGYKQKVPSPTYQEISNQTPSTMVHLPQLNEEEAKSIPEVFVNSKSK